MFDLFDNGSLAMRISDTNLKKALSSHFMSTFETGGKTSWRKNDELIHNARRKVSNIMFGFDAEQLPDGGYEKFGYLASKDPARDIEYAKSRDSDVGLNLYGNVVVRFRKDRVVASFTVGDSLNAEVRLATKKSSAAPEFVEDAKDYETNSRAAKMSASLITDPQPSSMLKLADGTKTEWVRRHLLPKWAASIEDKTEREIAMTWVDSRENHGIIDQVQAVTKAPLSLASGESVESFVEKRFRVPYVEVQFHGELAKSDIESISFPDEKSIKKLGKASLSELAKQGVAIFVGGKKMEL